MIRHIPLEVTDTQRSNLAQLARHLLDPNRRTSFDMQSYLSNDSSKYSIYATEALSFVFPAGECGTIACAAGHGPYAGIEALSQETWRSYIRRVFGAREYTGASEIDYVDMPNALFHYLFDSEWVDFDNTAAGAAQRILYVLEHGIPVIPLPNGVPSDAVPLTWPGSLADDTVCAYVPFNNPFPNGEPVVATPADPIYTPSHYNDDEFDYPSRGSAVHEGFVGAAIWFAIGGSFAGAALAFGVHYFLQ